MTTDIKQIVKDKYTDVATQKTSCCGPSCCSEEELTNFSENYDQLEGYDPDADLGLGCGIPTAFAKIEKGNTVLDLGSGAGNDVFVARSLVGETGKVIGVDMTEAMIAKANQNKAKLGYGNVEFLLGDIEDLPLEPETVDVAISNCVLNLVPDKQKAYAEVYRVLRKGGHFSMSDIVLQGTLTPAVQNAAELYAGCVSGALQKEDYLKIIEQNDFKNIRIVKERKIELPDDLLLEYLTPEQVKDFRASNSSIFSITVIAEK